MVAIISIDQIVNKIYWLRGVKVMLDRDLAVLYEVETKVLKRNVRRHIKRFPADFMFELSNQEVINLRCQIDTSSWGGTRYVPMAFTEQGVAMLSGILRGLKSFELPADIWLRKTWGFFPWRGKAIEYHRAAIRMRLGFQR